jgi:hypothetical protein
MINYSEIYVVVAINVDGFALFNANDLQRKNAHPINDDNDGLTDEDPPEDEDGDGFIEFLLDITDPDNPIPIRREGIDNDNDGRYAEDWIGGVDLNRNYDYEWEHGVANKQHEMYRGPAPFSEPEACAIRDLVLQHSFQYAIDFHSGAELILYPWGTTYDPPPDEAEFIEIAKGLSNVTGGTEYEQSSRLYFSYGAFDDWVYGKADVLALTCEVFVNDTWEGVTHPGPSPNTVWTGGLRYAFNPFPSSIESVVLRWLPVFFYITNRTLNESYHNLAVKKVELEKTIVGESFTMKLNVSVQNKGTFSETFNVTVNANSTKILDLTSTLTARESGVLTFTWNTTGFPKGNYTISVYVTPVLNETETTDNSLTGGFVVVAMVGDVNADGYINIKDVTLVSAIFGAIRGDLQYQPNADVNGDGYINIKDIVLVSANFGAFDP